VIRPKLLEAGFKLVVEQHLEVTDDVSIVEAMHEPVQITKGSYTNIKVRHEDSVPMSVRSCIVRSFADCQTHRRADMLCHRLCSLRLVVRLQVCFGLY